MGARVVKPARAWFIADGGGSPRLEVARVTAGDPRQDPEFLHYAIDRILPHACEPLFDIAADVEKYPEFLPGWVAVRTRRTDTAVYETDQVLKFGPIRERFESKTHMERPHRIRVVSHSRTFKHFEVNWRFEPLEQGGCRVHLDSHVGFKSRYVKKVVGVIFPRTVDDVLAAFERRADELARKSALDRGGDGSLDSNEETTRER